MFHCQLKIAGAIILLILVWGNYASPVKAGTSFPDVDVNSPFAQSVQDVVEKGNVVGFPDGTFRPQSFISRAEFIALALKVGRYQFKGNEPKSENCFVDVHDEWFASNMCKAKEEKLVTGSSDGHAYPTQNINFAEASAIATKIMHLDTSEYINDSEPWYYPFVKALESKLAIPFTISRFDQYITREEAAYVLTRSASYSTPYGTNLSYDDIRSLTAIQSSSERFSYVFQKLFGGTLLSNKLPKDIDFTTFKRIVSVTGPELYRDRNRIYCRSFITNKLSPLKGADPQSFQVFYLGGWDVHMITDKNYVYSVDEENGCYSPESKIGRKKQFLGNIFTDGEDVFYYNILQRDEKKRKFVRVEGADAKTLAPYAPFSNFLGGTIFEDKNALYFYEKDSAFYLKNLRVDKKTFSALNPSGAHSSSNNWVVFQDKNGVYFARPNALDKKKTFLDADLDTFKLLSAGYLITAIDKNTLYSVNDDGNLRKISDVDTATFEPVSAQGDGNVDLYAKDKNRVYRTGDFSVIEWADPALFEVYGWDYGWPGDPQYFIFGHNGSSFWYGDNDGKEILVDEIEPRSFIKMSRGHLSFTHHVDAGFIPENFLYTDPGVCKIIEKDFLNGQSWASTPDRRKAKKTFEKKEDGTCVYSELEYRDAHDVTTEGFVAKDARHVWKYDTYDSKFSIINGIDGASFEAIGESHLFKDINGVYYLNETTLNLLPEADPKTIEIMKEGETYFLKDAKHVWSLVDGPIPLEKATE